MIVGASASITSTCSSAAAAASGSPRASSISAARSKSAAVTCFDGERREQRVDPRGMALEERRGDERVDGDDAAAVPR